jgi:hypothetical protein
MRLFSQSQSSFGHDISWHKIYNSQIFSHDNIIDSLHLSTEIKIHSSENDTKPKSKESRDIFEQRSHSQRTKSVQIVKEKKNSQKMPVVDGNEIDLSIDNAASRSYWKSAHKIIIMTDMDYVLQVIAEAMRIKMQQSEEHVANIFHDQWKRDDEISYSTLNSIINKIDPSLPQKNVMEIYRELSTRGKMKISSVIIYIIPFFFRYSG